MSMNLNLGVRALAALSYVVLLALAGGANVSAHRGSNETGSATQLVAASTPAVIEENTTETVTGSALLLGLGLALCGFATGAAGAFLVQIWGRAIQRAARRRFAAAAATAIPTVGVRLSASAGAIESHPAIFRYHAAAAKPLAHF